MTQEKKVAPQILDDVQLTLDEFCNACNVDTHWVIERVSTGILSEKQNHPNEWTFTSVELLRARRLKTYEQDFEANQELAGLVVDLIEEVNTLRRKLKRYQID